MHGARSSFRRAILNSSKVHCFCETSVPIKTKWLFKVLMPAQKMYLLDLGALSGDKYRFLPGSLGVGAARNNRNPQRTWIEIPIAAALIEHEEGLVLLGAGASPDVNNTGPRATEEFPLTSFSDQNLLEKLQTLEP